MFKNMPALVNVHFNIHHFFYACVSANLLGSDIEFCLLSSLYKFIKKNIHQEQLAYLSLELIYVQKN